MLENRGLICCYLCQKLYDSEKTGKKGRGTVRRNRGIVAIWAVVALFVSGCSVFAGDTAAYAAAFSGTAGTQAVTMGIAEFEQLLSEQPLAVVKTEYIVQDEQYKLLYPDMLQAVIQNNTTEDIKDAVVAFVAWDENRLPVKIEGQFDLGGGTYIKRVNYLDINLVGGDTYGENSGYSLGEHCEIETFKAIAVSYETFDGKTWENPYYDAFRVLYEGQKLK